MKKILLSLAAFFMICCTVCAQKKEKQTTNELSSKTLVAYFLRLGQQPRLPAVLQTLPGESCLP